MKKIKNCGKRKGIRDIWNAVLVKDCRNKAEGIPKNSIVCLGVVASDIRKSANWPEYEKYLKLMVQELRPRIILVYGSARYKFFKDLQNQGIVVKSYQAARNRKKAPAGDCHE